ncbi:ATP-binding cassette domain-containing protein, partial [Rhizobium leguminosarum]|uniref:ATP-binding cassette domain-containing protein n=1 Tax=Rhizobium leguminosarum TaxID=384 RepID=UPI003F9AB3B1
YSGCPVARQEVSELLRAYREGRAPKPGWNPRCPNKVRHGTFLKPAMRELVAVDSLDLTLRSHETLGLVGESGSGKTTFGQAILRLNT